MIKKVLSIIITIILVFTLGLYSIASEVSELQNKKDEAEDKKEEISNQKDSLMDEISGLNVQISQYEREIEKLNNKIGKLEANIKKSQKEIKRLEKETEEKEKLLMQRLVAMYEAGQTTYLDILLSSEDITSLLSNYYRIEEIAEADQSVINSIKEKQAETEDKKEQLEKEKKEVSNSKAEVEKKSESLETAKVSKQAKVNNLSAKEKELQEQIDEFEEQIEEAKKQSSQNQDHYYTGSFEGVLSWPISESSPDYNLITSFYGLRPQPIPGASTNHGAIDIGVSYVPVHAAAAGVIVSAGWMSGYGNYIEIDHGNGYYTAYGHLNSFNVSPGQTVSRGDQIAISGNTGNSSGPHLHYEVYIGGLGLECRVDPLQYTTHPPLR